MARVVVTVRIMPADIGVDLEFLKRSINNEIERFAGEKSPKAEIVPVAFGLKSLNMVFVMDEAKGSTEPLEKAIAAISGVGSAEITDVRRAIG